MLRRLMTMIVLLGLLWVPVAPQARAGAPESVIVQAGDTGDGCGAGARGGRRGDARDWVSSMRCGGTA